MRLVSCLRLLPLVLILALSGCSQKWSWHQRLSLVVETPAGPISASSVTRRSLRFTDGWFVPPEARGAASSYSGEAVVLEVAPGRYLFALLGAPNPFEVFFPREAPVEVAPQLEALREVRAVPRRQYPTLVTFGDVADPTTVARVDPDDLAASFGPGVALRGMTLEITDDPVTKGVVEGVLGWLGPYPEPRLMPGDGRTTNIPFAMKVHHGDFIRRSR